MLDCEFQWGRLLMGLLCRELLPPASALPELGKRLWLDEGAREISTIYKLCIAFMSFICSKGLIKILICHTWSERSVSWLFHKAHPVTIQSTSWVWWVIYRSQNACSASVEAHPATEVEGADCEMVVEEGGLCAAMLLERRWGYLWLEDHLK